MPELPEVEVIRAGLAQAVSGSRVTGVEVRDPRALRRHRLVAAHPTGIPLETDFEARLVGALLTTPARRGKFLWIPIEDAPAGPSRTALLAHLGMSGQLLLRTPEQPDDRHVRVRLWLESDERGELRLDFSDQRLFGSLAIDELVSTPDGAPAGQGSALAAVPSQAAHIARDPLDPAFPDGEFLAALRQRSSAIKKALLDQGLVSGVGNIYADEALWLARVHPETPASALGASRAARLLDAVRDVFSRALAEGGTSFDSLYVNVNGESGYFAHSLNAYGRTGEPCARCGGPIRRTVLGARGTHFCPRCQRKR